MDNTEDEVTLTRSEYDKMREDSVLLTVILCVIQQKATAKSKAITIENILNATSRHK